MAKYNAEHKAVLDNELLSDPRVRPGKMFGFPAYYVNGKLCICLYEEGVGVKLPAVRATELLQNDPNTIRFQPMGKSKMREWIQINLANSEDYRRYVPVFQESVAYVLALQDGGAQA